MQNKVNQILFLNLFAFSLTGGVEKVSRNFVAALSKLFAENKWASYSMHDHIKDLDERYCEPSNYDAFGGKKLAFIWASIRKSLKSDVLVLSHINLLLVAKLVSIIKPKQRFILFAHGIEVWGDIAQWKIRFLKKNVDVWAVSNFTKQKLMALYGIPEHRIQILNNSLSPFLDKVTDFTKPAYLIDRYQLSTGIPVLYTLSRLSSSEQYKGYDTVIAALADLKKLSKPFTYLLAGKADAMEKARVEQLIASHDLKNEVKLIGYLPDTEITDHFLLADAFIMPSTGEGFGIVFIEAAACGCQVIGGNVDGSTDALLNGELGQMVNPEVLGEVSAAIEHAIKNKAHQSQKQQALAYEHFGFEQYVDKVNCLINESVN